MQELNLFEMMHSEFSDIFWNHLGPALTDTDISNLTLVNKRLNEWYSTLDYKIKTEIQRLKIILDDENISYSQEDLSDLLKIDQKKLLLDILSDFIKFANDEIPIINTVKLPQIGRFQDIIRKVLILKNETLCKLLTWLVLSKHGVIQNLLDMNLENPFSSYLKLIKIIETLLEAKILDANYSKAIKELDTHLDHPIAIILSTYYNLSFDPPYTSLIWDLDFTRYIQLYETTLNINISIFQLINMRIRKHIQWLYSNGLYSNEFQALLTNHPNSSLSIALRETNNQSNLGLIFYELNEAPLFLEWMDDNLNRIIRNPRAVALVIQTISYLEKDVWSMHDTTEFLSSILKSDFTNRIRYYLRKYDTETMSLFFSLGLDYKEWGGTAEKTILPLLMSRHVNIVTHLDFDNFIEILTLETELYPIYHSRLIRNFVNFILGLPSKTLARLIQLCDEARPDNMDPGLSCLVPLLFLIFRKVLNFSEVTINLLSEKYERLLWIAFEATLDENIFPLRDFMLKGCKFAYIDSDDDEEESSFHESENDSGRYNDHYSDSDSDSEEEKNTNTMYVALLTRYQSLFTESSGPAYNRLRKFVLSLPEWATVTPSELAGGLNLTSAEERSRVKIYSRHIEALKKSINFDILIKKGFTYIDMLSKTSYTPANVDMEYSECSLLNLLAYSIPSQALHMLLDHGPNQNEITPIIHSNPGLRILADHPYNVDSILLKALSTFTIEELDKLASYLIIVNDIKTNLLTILNDTAWDTSFTHRRITKLCKIFVASTRRIELENLPESTDGNDLVRLFKNYLPLPWSVRYTKTELAFFKKQKEEAKTKRIVDEMGSDYLQDSEDHSDPVGIKNLKNSDTMNI